MKSQLGNMAWYALLVALLLSALGLGYLIWLSYFQLGIDLRHGPDATDRGMNLLSVVYFLANTLVALIACFSIAYARGQIKHAEESRRANVYMELDKRYQDEKVQYSYRMIVAFVRNYEDERHPGESLPQYAHRKMLVLYQEHLRMMRADPTQETRYRKTLSILGFFEYISVLVSRGYLKSDDLFDFMGGIIVKTEDVLKEHLKWVRGRDPRIYANALILMKKARKARYTKAIRSFNEGDYVIT